jgi:zinc D-Ala-D-Ala carboxypeptidase
MNLSPHFSLEELTATDVRRGIDNTPSPDIIQNLRLLAVSLESVRFLLNAGPIRINSGYRCAELNEAIGGSKWSAHMIGLAADIVCPKFSPIEVCRAIASSRIEFDQVIYEGTWCHFGISMVQARRQLLTARFSKSGTTYDVGLLA